MTNIINTSMARPEIIDKANEIKSKIELNSNIESTFGSELTVRTANMSAGNDKVKSFDSVGVMVSDAVKLLSKNPFEDQVEHKGILRIFKKIKKNTVRTFEEIQLAYLPIRTQIEKVELSLKSEQTKLVESAKNTNAIIKEHIEAHDELVAHIIAGKQFLKEFQEGELLEAYNKTLGEDGEAYMNDYLSLQQKADNLENDIFALEQSRYVVFQTIPELRISQKNDIALSQQLNRLLLSGIPAWRTKINVHINNQRAEQAANAVLSIKKATNDIMIEVSNNMLQTSKKVDELSNSELIKIETFEKVHSNLLEILNSTTELTETRRVARDESNARLVEMANELTEAARNNQGRILTDKQREELEAGE